MSQFGGTPVVKSGSKFGGTPVGASPDAAAEPMTLQRFAAGMPNVGGMLEKFPNVGGMLEKLPNVGDALLSASPEQFAIGQVAGVPGFFGDIEQLGRYGLRAALRQDAISGKTVMPTSEEIGEGIGGKAKNAGERTIREIGSFVSPVGALKTMKEALKPIGTLASHSLGFTAGTGARPVEEAFKAGAEGGSRAEIFLDNMTKKVPLSDVVVSAEDALGEMKVARQQEYLREMARINADIKPLDFNVIDDVLRAHKDAGMSRNGMIEIKPGAAQVREVIGAAAKEFRDNPALRTAQDFDELKQKINNLQWHGELSKIAGPGTPGSTIIRDVRDAISKEINRIDPTYAKVMRDYHEASKTLDEIKGTLSLNPNARVDTALRKLQSVMRDNVQTSYGYRADLVGKMDKRNTVMPALAGQSLAAWDPRGGVGKFLLGTEGILAILGAHPGALAAAPLSIPRVVGNMAYRAGQASNSRLARALTPENAFRASLANQIPQLFPMPDNTDLRTALGTR